MVMSRHVGTAADAARQAFKIKNLQVGKPLLAIGSGLEKGAHLFFARVAFVYTRIVGAKFAEQGFEIAQERSGVRQAFVPEDDDPAGWLQDADKFGSRSIRIEPVK